MSHASNYVKDAEDLAICLSGVRGFQAVGSASAETIRRELSCKFSKNIKESIAAGWGEEWQEKRSGANNSRDGKGWVRMPILQGVIDSAKKLTSFSEGNLKPVEGFWSNEKEGVIYI